MPRYVILQHELPSERSTDERSVHWDFMLEQPTELATWSLPDPPHPQGEIVVVSHVARLAAHRKRYLDYRGPVSGNRGLVTSWDEGVYDLISEIDDVVPRRWEVELEGRRLAGRLSLVQDPPESLEKLAENETLFWTFSLKMKK
jgi:hypothetical protein